MRPYEIRKLDGCCSEFPKSETRDRDLYTKARESYTRAKLNIHRLMRGKVFGRAIIKNHLYLINNKALVHYAYYYKFITMI